MTLKEHLLAQLDRELDVTREVLSRMPENKYDWSPHEKSWGFGKMATHIANLYVWAAQTASSDGFNLATDKAELAEEQTTRDGLLAILSDAAGAARDAISALSDDDLGKTYTLRAGDQEIFASPKASVIQDMILSHVVHHRAQLSVYLRMNDIALPAMYGPSGDES